MSLLTRLVDKCCRLYGTTLAGLHDHRLILCYHNVGNKSDISDGWISKNRLIDTDLFEQQMRWLKSNYDVVHLDTLMAASGRTHRPQIAVTFDDGYRNNIDFALPVIERHDIPMTWFVTTGFVENPNRIPWWDLIDLMLAKCTAPIRLKESEVAGVYDPQHPENRDWLNTTLRKIIKTSACDRRDAIAAELAAQIGSQLPMPENAFARVEQVAGINSNLVRVGGHTVTHPNLTRCSDATRQQEISVNKLTLEQISSAPVKWFAYPFGGPGTFDDNCVGELKLCGFEGAVTLIPGLVNSRTDRYKVPRLAITPSMSLESFKARVSGAPLYVMVQKLRAGMTAKHRRY